jgi:GAF domain-containing protein
MRRFLRRLLRINFTYGTTLDRQRALGLLLGGYILIVFGMFALVTGGLGALEELLRTNNWDDLALTYALLIGPISILFAGLVIAAVQRGALRTASWLFVLYHLLTIAPQFSRGFVIQGAGGNIFTAVILLSIPVVAAGVLLRRGEAAFVWSVVLVIIGLAYLTAPLTSTLVYFPLDQRETDASLVFFALGVNALYLFLFIGNVQQLIGQSLGEGEQLAWINEFNARVSTLQDEPSVLREALRLLSERFGYAFAEIYLVNESNQLVARASTLIGADQGERFIELNDANALSASARARQPVIVTQNDYPTRRTHFLASTRLAAAIPLTLGEQVVGVLDIQQDRLTPFYTSTLNLLMLIGTEIASALLGQRLTQELRRALAEQSDITNNLRAQLQTRDERRLAAVSGAWEEYLRRRGQSAFGFDLVAQGAVPLPAADVPDALADTLLTGEVSVVQQGTDQVINVPIRLAGETLGAMSFNIPMDRPLAQRQIETAKSVADRLALALDNTRLLEQTRAQALRERKASELGNVLISANDVSTLLDMAAENFNDALGAIHTRIYLQPNLMLLATPDEPPANGKS